jgi:hypothetical protein
VKEENTELSRKTVINGGKIFSLGANEKEKTLCEKTQKSPHSPLTRLLAFFMQPIAPLYCIMRREINQIASNHFPSNCLSLHSDSHAFLEEILSKRFTALSHSGCWLLIQRERLFTLIFLNTSILDHRDEVISGERERVYIELRPTDFHM